MTNSLITNGMIQAGMTAAVSSLSSQMAVRVFANQGNIGRALKDLASPTSLESFIISVGTAAATQGISNYLDINAAPEALKGLSFSQVLEMQAQASLVQAGVSSVARVATGQHVGDAVVEGLKIAAAKTAASFITYQGTDLYNTDAFNYPVHKTVLAVSGAIEGAVRNTNDPLRGAGAGALSAVVTGVVQEAQVGSGLDSATQAGLAQLSGAIAALIAFQDEESVNTAIATATTTTDNFVAKDVQPVPTHIDKGKDKVEESSEINDSSLPTAIEEAYRQLLVQGYAPENAALIINHPDIRRSLEGRLHKGTSTSEDKAPDSPVMYTPSGEPVLNITISEYTLDPLTKAMSLAEEGALGLNRFTDDHPHLAQGAAIALQVALGGPVKMLVDQTLEYIGGDLKREAQQAIVEMVAEKTYLPETFIESTSAVVGFGLSIATGRVKAALKDAKQVSHAIEKRIHKNSLQYVGDTHVYSIQRVKDGQFDKIGKGTKIRKRDGASARAEQQVRRLQRDTGDRYVSKIRKKFDNNADALKYETKAIKKTRAIKGENVLPGNKGNR